VQINENCDKLNKTEAQLPFRGSRRGRQTPSEFGSQRCGMQQLMRGMQTRQLRSWAEQFQRPEKQDSFEEIEENKQPTCSVNKAASFVVSAGENGDISLWNQVNQIEKYRICLQDFRVNRIIELDHVPKTAQKSGQRGRNWRQTQQQGPKPAKLSR